MPPLTQVCEALLSRVLSCLEENGKLQNLIIERVPGSNEIPSCIDLILNNNSLDCMIGLGVVIKGSTSHHTRGRSLRPCPAAFSYGVSYSCD